VAASIGAVWSARSNEPAPESPAEVA
jgi:hypothetical protein